MKVDSYYVSLKENDCADLICRAGSQEIFVCELNNVSGLTAEQLEMRAKEELHLHDIEVAPGSNTGTNIYMDDQKVDLSLVRTKMRQILKELSDKDTPVAKRKELLDIYQQMCSSAQIIVNVCKLELQIDQITCDQKKRK